MRKRYCDQESVFAHIWDNADAAGLWTGNASTVAAEFNVSEDEAYAALSDLCDRGLIEKLVPGTYAISEWPERNESGEEELE